MKNKFNKKISVIAAIAILLSGCGPSNGMKVSNALAPGLNDDNGSSGGVPDVGPEFKAQDLSGTVEGGPQDGTSMIVYDVSEHAIQIRIPMPGLIPTGELEIPNVPDSKVFIDASNPLIPVLVVQIPGMYVLGHLGFDPGQVGLDPTLLPNGEAIPFTPGGEPPRISFQIPNINRVVQVYLGINVVAVFVASSFDPMVDLTFPIRNQSSAETIGYFSTVRRRLPYQGGFFVSLNMPARIAGFLDDHLRKVIVP